MAQPANEAVEPVAQLYQDRPHVSFYKVREETDPLLDASLLDTGDSDQRAEVEAAIGRRFQKNLDDGFPGDREADLGQIVLGDKNAFRTSISSRPPARVTALKTDLVSDARSMRVRLRIYSQEQRTMVSK